MGFSNYLVGRYGYSEFVLKRKLKQLDYLYQLCGEELKYYDYERVLNLVGVLKQSYSVGVVNAYLQLLDQYYSYLMEAGDREDNVVKGFRLKGAKPKLYRGFLSTHQLDKIYLLYPKSGHYGGRFDLYTKRNRVLLGLLIYQGLNLSDVKDVLLSDVDLEKGIISINAGTSSSKYNSRVLPLDSKQILDLLEYKDKVQGGLLAVMNLGSSNKQLIPLGSKTRYSVLGISIKKQIQKYFKLESIGQLRRSRIALWLKRYNLREVQYMSGYKRLSSLERYQLSDVESLKEAVKKYHPNI